MIDLLTHEFRFRVTVPGYLELDDAKAVIERVREVAYPVSTLGVTAETYSFDFTINGEDLVSIDGEDVKARDNVEAAFSLGALIWDLNVELQGIDTGISVEPVS